MITAGRAPCGFAGHRHQPGSEGNPLGAGLFSFQGTTAMAAFTKGKPTTAPMGKSAQAGMGGKSMKAGGIRTPFTSAIVKGGGKMGGKR